MPYKSDAQRRFFHSKGAAKAGISKATVKEYDKASKGKALPEKLSGQIKEQLKRRMKRG